MNFEKGEMINSIYDWYGQVTKSVWGMSRCQEAKKDVIGCDKPGVGVK